MVFFALLLFSFLDFDRVKRVEVVRCVDLDPGSPTLYTSKSDSEENVRRPFE